jgi:biopolymer transport protein ExbB
MLPLALCSLAALAIIIERALALRRNSVIPPRIVRVLDDYSGENSATTALALCQRHSGAFARIIAEVIKMRHLNDSQALELMRAVGRSEIGKLERGLTVLEIIAGVSPLLGLLGTVLGMVEVFRAISAKGLGDPQILSDGISKALITTIVGLTVAIPALAFHGIYNRRVEDLGVEMQDRATTLIMRLQDIKPRK